MIIADIIIAGGGAAGLAAASGACETSGLKVIVLEKMPRPGRKIMITGKGRCNLTNLKNWQEFSSHIYPKPNFIKSAFYNFPPESLMEFLKRNGLETEVERGDRVFPKSRLSRDVVDTLCRAAASRGAEIMTDEEITDIKKEGNDFILTTAPGRTYTCKKLVIATGGLSYPATGSTGDGYRWAEEAGMKVNKCFPSLTAIVPKNYKAGTSVQGHIDRTVPLSETGRLLKGIQLKNVSVSLSIDGNIAAEEFGDLDFTDGGIEGPIGFRISRKAVRAIMNGSRVGLMLDMKPAVMLDDLEKRIAALWKEISEDRRSYGKPYRDRFRILVSKLMPSDLVNGFIKCCPDVDHRKLAKALKGWKFEISGYVGYERCVITAGGIATDELVSKTMESKKVPGLYFAGEVIDIDGDTGGYNLQTAFSTGMLAGQSAAKSFIR